LIKPEKNTKKELINKLMPETLYRTGIDF